VCVCVCAVCAMMQVGVVMKASGLALVQEGCLSACPLQ